MMTTAMRKPLVAALVLLAVTATASAQLRGRPVMPPFGAGVSGNMVSGTVTSLDGPLALLDGLVTIDLSGAKISGDAINVGVVLFAVLKSGDVAAGAPLPASYVIVSRIPQLLTGPVGAVDLAAHTLTLFGRTITTDTQTLFTSAVPLFRAASLSDILPKSIVQADVFVSGHALVARSVRILSFNQQPLPTVVHGIVTNISSTAWTLNANGKDVIVLIDAQTKITPNIGIGDVVEAVVDSTGTAISIVNIGFAVRLTGTVKSVGAMQWIITPGDPGSHQPDMPILINANTKISGDPKVGDRVEIFGEMVNNAPIVATSITKLP
jgi:hypothetical protein